MNSCIPNSPLDGRPFVALLLASQGPAFFNKVAKPNDYSKSLALTSRSTGAQGHINAVASDRSETNLPSPIEPLQQYLIGPVCLIYPHALTSIPGQRIIVMRVLLTWAPQAHYQSYKSVRRPIGFLGIPPSDFVDVSIEFCAKTLQMFGRQIFGRRHLPLGRSSP